MMLIEVELVEIQINGDQQGSQVVILQEKDGARGFAIFIGPYEAAILDQTVHRIETSRPLTHDLILNAIDGLNGTLTGIAVSELRNETFVGKLLVRNGDGETVEIDTRPSDALILAIKRRVPIYAAEEVLSLLAQEEDED